MFESLEQYLSENGYGRIMYTPFTCNIMEETNKIFTEEFLSHLYEEGIVTIFPEVCVIEDKRFQALATERDKKLYIVLFNGIFEKHNLYLRSFNNGILNNNDEYASILMKYTWEFIVMHEYGHLFCGHCLGEKHYRIAQECEADLVASRALIKMIVNKEPLEKIEECLMDCFVAIFYFFKDLDINNSFDDAYNIFKAENYYEEKNRDHPLNSQRILSVFQEFNVYSVDEKLKKSISIQKLIFDKLFEMGEKQSDNPQVGSIWIQAKDSVEKMRNTVEEIRVRIPRLSK